MNLNLNRIYIFHTSLLGTIALVSANYQPRAIKLIRKGLWELEARVERPPFFDERRKNSTLIASGLQRV